MNTIERFGGQYEWLSNFYPVHIHWEGDRYPSVEHAYQAAKFDRNRRAPFWGGTAAQAKRMGQRLGRRSDWDSVKLSIMLMLIRQKFAPNTHLSDLLLATGNARIVEGNHWHDTYWGVCDGVGMNHLGNLIMSVRRELGGQ